MKKFAIDFGLQGILSLDGAFFAYDVIIGFYIMPSSVPYSRYTLVSTKHNLCRKIRKSNGDSRYLDSKSQSSETCESVEQTELKQKKHTDSNLGKKRLSL